MKADCKQLLAFFLVLLCSFCAVVSAQLKSQEKQEFLDSHNYYRASVNGANMKRLNWSVALEREAQQTADRCDSAKERGMNIFYNTSILPQNSFEVFDQVLNSWLSESVQQPVLWSRTSQLGCAVADCERLPLDNGNKIARTRLFVCKYTPSYWSSGERLPYREGPCSSTSCPKEANLCVKFTGSVGRQGSVGSYCASNNNNPQVPEDAISRPIDRRMYNFRPYLGSVAGGNNIVISGRGFSNDQYSGGNKVTFFDPTGRYRNITCDVISYRSSKEKIECVTREAPVQNAVSSFQVVVHSNDGSGFEEVPGCSGCRFHYHTSTTITPRLRNLSPLASLHGAPVTLEGFFRAVSFDDPEDPKDSSSTDKDNEADDHFTRILIGGRACNHMKEDGSMYNASIAENGISGSIQCLPELDNVIESHNASAILARRGSAFVNPQDLLDAIDNKFRPYHFQTYADILDVTPRVGSAEGGTRITVTVSNSLIEYQDDVKVFVGGLPCLNVTVLTGSNRSFNGVIECVTSKQPPRSTYYPGGRGTLREVWTDTTSLNTIHSRARSEKQIVYERFFLSSDLTGSDFGETSYFGHRLTGFFVPPVSSNYTFNIRSDDSSRLYLSPNASSDHTQLVLSTGYTARSWNRFSRQISEPRYLEAERPYYFEVVAVNYPGPWEVGLGVKLHNSTLVGGLYDADYEEQRIRITSSIVDERHAVDLEALPLVQRVTIRSVDKMGSGEVPCSVSLNITRNSRLVDTVSFSPFSSSRDVEEELNKGMNVGRVSVQKGGYSGDQDMFWLSDIPIEFTVIFLTPFGTMMNDIPILSTEERMNNFSCSAEDSNSTMQLSIEVEMIQGPSYPETFSAGFAIGSQQQRLTGRLPLNASSSLLQDELTRLLSWGCNLEENIEQQTFSYYDYEAEGSGNRRNNTAFCGSYSNRNPRTVWSSSSNQGSYRVDTVPYICFAYRGTFPGLSLSVNYRRLERNMENPTVIVRQMSTTLLLNDGRCSGQPFTATKNSDGWTDYICVNVRECLANNFESLANTELVTNDRVTITQVTFGNRNSFYIDNLAIARSTIQISRDNALFPVRPNGVVINYVQVVGGVLLQPTLLNRSISSQSETNSTNPSFSMVVSRYNVTYSVLDCGFGIGLLTGSYDNNNPVRVEQLQAASRPVGGYFGVTIGNRALPNISATVTANNLEELLNITYRDVGGFSVSRSGSCSGYSWNVKWVDEPGDQPMMSIAGDQLVGSEPEISIEELVDGGTWIRPLRGDMMRTPETEPQVEVIINGIPSSCSNKNCSFSFETSMTPELSSLSPTEGRAGTFITIYGTGFSERVEDVEVVIGRAVCEVSFANESMIQCEASAQSAGSYKVKVLISGVGMAAAENDSACFQYLLHVESVSPMIGGVSGGHVIIISGDGFIEFSSRPRERLGTPFSSLPWFRYGFGLPDLGNNVEYCSGASSVAESVALAELVHSEFSRAIPASLNQLRDGGLRTFLMKLYSQFPSRVHIDGDPCIITESSISQLLCVPILSNPGMANITVSVRDQIAVLDNAYEKSIEKTAAVKSVTPSTGVVTGGNNLTITGTLLASGSAEEGEVEVMVGNASCVVQQFNATRIQCITSGQHPPGRVPVLISTKAGIAIWESVLTELEDFENMTDLSSYPFPWFTYRLRVTGISFSRGSVFGGAGITITGGDFVQGETRILFGEQKAEISSITRSQIVFVTPTSSRMHHVQLSAELVVLPTGVAYQFEWDRNELEITVGDRVTWNWEVNLNTSTRLELNLDEIESPQSGSNVIVIKNGGISNRGNTTPEVFSFAFNQTGTYYFVTRNNLNTKELIGVVNVTEPAAVRREVRVYVGGFLAQYIPSEIGSGSGSSSGMVELPPNLRRKRQVSGGGPQMPAEEKECMDDIDSSSVSDGSLTFDYSPCLTPMVFSVEPSTGTRLRSVFTIRGEGFSASPVSNIVTFGGYPCIVEDSNATTISCRMSGDSSLSPPAGVPLSLSLRNTDPGYGYAYIQTPSTSEITLLPLINNISPSEGSLAGGTDLIISGDTFSFTENSLMVRLGSLSCTVTLVSYSEIRCRTAPRQEEGREDVRFSVGGANNDIVPYCDNNDGCSFNYTEDRTPMVEDVSPERLREPGNNTIEISGWGFSENLESNVVRVNSYPCYITRANETFISCELLPLPADRYTLTVKVCNLTNDRCFGYASIMEDDRVIQVDAGVTNVSPKRGSVDGGTELTLSGYGFNVSSSSVAVRVGSSNCEVREISHGTLRCITSAANAPGMADIEVNDGMSTIIVENDVVFEFTMAYTPTVTSISPTSGQIGENVTLTGTLFGSDMSSIEVVIGGEPCLVLEVVNETSLTCQLGGNFAGPHSVELTVQGVGNARIQSNLRFTYNLVVSSLSNTSGSIAGQNVIQVYGAGFNPSNTTIIICGHVCSATPTVPSITEIECRVPPASEDLDSVTSDKICNVTVESVGMSVTSNDQYTYRLDLTPRVISINDTRGGTEGGTPLAIHGTGFTQTALVTIAGSPCLVWNQNATLIECVTERSGRTVRERVMVEIERKGFAISSAEFWYVDLWSSNFTWGGGPLPREGDFVVISRGQTVILDTKTPVLAYLLIQGGELIFDREKGDNEVELHTQGALITSGGRFEVGTEKDPFTSKTQIVLYGHVLSTEIPVYGAKTLALRQGELDLHGRVLNVTWTRLARTARKGDTEIYLKDWVAWEVGGRIVLASTSFSQRENEEMVIADVWSGAEGSIVNLTTPLQYEHISVEQTIAGRTIETRGEVGYLSRNVVVRGNVNEEWQERVEACPREFRPGQFQVQSCFQGRFGAEIVGDQFGSQIMIHAPEQNQGHVTARIEYIEVTHAGQAFRLGRYPIHFHLNGNVTGSYVRGCGIHHTFNRAVTIHAVDYLLIEKNVAFNILGHAYFTEDGIEQFNIIQDNLGVFVRASSSLLNVDITPATFWLVNANNIVRRNAAAGGTHFGFWYRLPVNPTGPSFTTSVCPRKQRVLEFSNNTAHSFGWYGLWVFRQYFPTTSGECNDNKHAPSHFDGFLAWRNDRGVEFAEIGALQLRDSVMMDNTLAGVEITEIESIWSEENGPLISNSLIVGHSSISSSDFCTESGIKTPKSYYLTVSGVTFVNFDRSGCYPIQACSHCKMMQGGFETRYKKMTLMNTGSKLTKWQWEHEHIHRDLDGSLTGSNKPKLLIPTNEMLDPSKCSHHLSSSDGGNTNGTMGSICDGDVEFGRLAVYDPTPSSLEFAAISIVNSYGNTTLPYVLKRLRGTGAGYMALLELNRTYEIVWLEGQTFTNISYTTKISGFPVSGYIILQQQYPRPLDFTQIGGVVTPGNTSVLADPASARTGDFFLENSNTTINYIIKGGNFSLNEATNQFRTYKCFYLNCIPPPPPTLPPPIPPGRPSVTMMWSNVSIWPNATLPAEGDDVTISKGMYVLIDVATLPRLATITIRGALEVFDSQDRVIEADLIIIEGGRFVAGYPETPFRNNLRIILHGNTSSPEFRYTTGTPTLGAKAIGVFGELILHAEPTSTKTWSLLSATVNPGDTQLTVVDNVDWQAGDKIVVTSTSYDAFQTEVFEIDSISQNRMLTIKGSFQHSHLGAAETIGSVQYSIRAEVGLLSRKIVIENGGPESANASAFGCRVLVSNTEDFRGHIQLQGVEFKGCGQLGYTDDFDPRFALAMVNIQRQDDVYVRECSFHDGFNTAIGLFGTDNVEINDNVIHSTVGPSMIITGSDHVIMRNLASLSQFIGTYRQRDEPSNALWTANYEIADTNRIIFINNHAAGGAKAGVHTNGEECTGTSSPTIRNNVAHSSLHCVHTGYRDGNPSGCSRFNSFTMFGCYHYGLFSYSQAGVQVINSTFINNKAAIYVSVIGPSSLSHQVGMKTVLIQDTKIISASKSFDCDGDHIRPAIADHKTSHSGIRTLSNGHVGIIIPSFTSGRGGFPKFPWPTSHNYPAINGMTTISRVSFVNFGKRCAEEKDRVIMTSSFSEDANHPVHTEQIVFESDGRFITAENPRIKPEYKLFVHESNIRRINPSDCVDMDCDGLKHVLIKDLDGTFSEEEGSLRTMVGMAELGWDGPDRRRGIGNFRIPKTMLTYANGSRIDADVAYPEKGIIRGTKFNTSNCSFNADWNMYHCSNLDHLMLVLESLDADTEVRRLSPIGLGANGYIDLLNGPMDNGWCGGYTCQERISTFYGIVASPLVYTIGLTSTNPQNFAIHLLNSNDSQGIVVRIIYNTPQRLDVYIDQNGEDVYVPPKNAELLPDGNLKYKERDASLPDDQFFPVFSDKHGANFYDRSLKQLHINIKGRHAYKIITTPVIMLSLTISVTTEDFFAEEFLVRNLALLLNIPSNRIRVVNVVRESRRRRRRQADDRMETIEFEIGNPPTPVFEDTITMNTTGPMNDTYSNGVMNTTDTSDNTNATDTLTFNRLTEVTEMVAAAVQTGELLKGSNGTSIVSAAIEDPIPPPVDPTGGVRATNQTGGIQPDEVGENSTIQTFFEKQQMNEAIIANTSTPVMELSIPSRLSITRPAGSSGLYEGIPLPNHLAPILTMLDNRNEISENLGVGLPWVLTATILSGPEGGVISNNAVAFSKGHANFEGLIFSHPGSYDLSFAVTYPENADFSIRLETVTVRERSLALEVYRQPMNGNTTFVLYPYPRVRLIDLTDGRMHLQDHTWRNVSWYVRARLLNRNSEVWSTELVEGEAEFTNIKISTAGKYQIEFETFTNPKTSFDLKVTSESFTINARQFTRFIITYEVDFNSTIEENEKEFIRVFEETFISAYPGAELYNTNVSQGSIIVSTFVTAQTTQKLLEIIKQTTTDPNTTLTLIFNNRTLIPSSLIQDPAYPVATENQLVLILATTIPAGMILLCGLLLICVVAIALKKRGNQREFRIKVDLGDPRESYTHNNIYVSNNDASSVHEYFLKTNEHELDDLQSTASTPNSQRKEKESFVVSESVTISVVPGSFFSNPSALDKEFSADDVMTESKEI